MSLKPNRAFFGERAKSGRGLKGEGNFLPASRSVAPPLCSSEQNRAEKLSLHFLFCAHPFLILKGKGNFSARQAAVIGGWRRGGAIGFFQTFLLKKVRAKCIITAPKLTLSELIAPLAVRAADGSLRKAKSALVFAVNSQSSLN